MYCVTHGQGEWWLTCLKQFMSTHNQDSVLVSAKLNPKEYQRLYYLQNKERKKAYSKQYTTANKEKLANYKRAYYDTHNNQIQEYRRAYYNTNKQQLSEYKKQYRTNNAEKVSQYKKEYYQKVKDTTRAEYLKQRREKLKLELQSNAVTLRVRFSLHRTYHRTERSRDLS